MVGSCQVGLVRTGSVSAYGCRRPKWRAGGAALQRPPAPWHSVPPLTLSCQQARSGRGLRQKRMPAYRVDNDEQELTAKPQYKCGRGLLVRRSRRIRAVDYVPALATS
jgi:hypothetical protein